MMGNALGRPARLATWTLVLCAAAGASGVAFASWMRHGAGIFTAMVQSGLSWCF